MARRHKRHNIFSRKHLICKSIHSAYVKPNIVTFLISLRCRAILQRIQVLINNRLTRLTAFATQVISKTFAKTKAQLTNKVIEQLLATSRLRLIANLLLDLLNVVIATIYFNLSASFTRSTNRKSSGTRTLIQAALNALKLFAKVLFKLLTRDIASLQVIQTTAFRNQVRTNLLLSALIKLSGRINNTLINQVLKRCANNLIFTSRCRNYSRTIRTSHASLLINAL